MTFFFLVLGGGFDSLHYKRNQVSGLYVLPATHESDFVTSQVVWKPILVHYETFTSVMFKLETSHAHIRSMDFSVK